MDVRTQRSGQNAGALEVQAGQRILQLGDLQKLGHHAAAHDHAVHGVGVKLAPELHQLVIAQLPGGAGDGAAAHLEGFGGVIIAVALHQNTDGIAQLHLLDVAADLAKHHREQIQLLEADGLVAGNEHPAPLAQTDEIVPGPDLGGRDLGTLGHSGHGSILLVHLGVDGAVVHGVDDGGGGGDGGQDVVLLHAHADGPGDVLGEQHRRIHGAEEFLHAGGAGALGLDAEAAQLPLEGIGLLQGGAPVIFAGIQLLQNLGEALAGLTVHALFESEIIVCHFSVPPYSLMTAVFAFSSTLTTRYSRPEPDFTPPLPSAHRLT